MKFGKLRIARMKAAVCIVLLLSLLVVSGVAFYMEPGMQLKRELKEFRQTLMEEDLGGMQLKIYYTDPSLLTYAPMTREDLLNSFLTQEIVIDNDQLVQHGDILKRLNAEYLVPIKDTDSMHARACYIFETEDHRIILEIIAGGLNDSDSVYVNGIEVEYSDIFLAIVDPLVDEKTRWALDLFFKGHVYNPPN